MALWLMFVLMTAAAILYVLQPLALLFVLRRYVVASLAMVSSGT